MKLTAGGCRVQITNKTASACDTQYKYILLNIKQPMKEKLISDYSVAIPKAMYQSIYF